MGMFDVFSKVTGGGEDESPDASDDESAAAAAANESEQLRPADCTPEDFRERAETLAGRSDVPELDFSEAALADVDSMATGTHPVDDELTYGSYLGETLVREYGGEWVNDDGWGVRVALGDEETTVAVFDAARMALDGTPVFEGVAARLHDQGDPYAEGTGESTAATTATDASATEGDATTEDDRLSEADRLSEDDLPSDGTDATERAESEAADEGDGEPDATGEAVVERADGPVDEPADESDVADVAEEKAEDAAEGDIAEADDEDTAEPESVDATDSTTVDATASASQAEDADDDVPDDDLAEDDSTEDELPEGDSVADDSAANEDLAVVDEEGNAAEAADVESDPDDGADATVDDESETAADARTDSTEPAGESAPDYGIRDEGHDSPVESDDESGRVRSETTADAVDVKPADGTSESDETAGILDEDDGAEPTIEEGAEPTSETKTDPTVESSADPTAEDTAEPTPGDHEDRPVEAAGDETEGGEDGKDGDSEGAAVTDEPAVTDGPQAASDDGEAEAAASDAIDTSSSEQGSSEDEPSEEDISHSYVAGRERDLAESDGEVSSIDGREDVDAEDVDVEDDDRDDGDDDEDSDGHDAEGTPIDDFDGAAARGPEDDPEGTIDRDAGVAFGSDATVDAETESEPVGDVDPVETDSTERGEDTFADEGSTDPADADDPSVEAANDDVARNDEPFAVKEHEDAVDEPATDEDEASTQPRTASSTIEEGNEIRDGPDDRDVFDVDEADVATDDGGDVVTDDGGDAVTDDGGDAVTDHGWDAVTDDEATESEDAGTAGIEDVGAGVEDVGVEGGDGDPVGEDEEPGESSDGDVDVETQDDAAARGDDPESTATAGPSRDDYEAPAIEFRNGWSEREFDFTPDSLARLDSFLDDQWDGRFRSGSLDGAATDPDEGSGPLLRVGAYVGEVLVQHYDGEWVAGDDGEPAVAVPGRHGRREAFPVFDVVRTSLLENAGVAYAVDAMANRLDLEIHASGAEETGFALGEAGPGTRASSADVITTVLDRAEDFVEAWPGYDLDYRPASLVRLDNLVERELDGEAFRATTLGDRTDADALRLADHAAGASAYFAAVLVRHLDAQWEIGAEVALAVEGPAGDTRVVPFDGSVACLRGQDSFMRRYDRVHDAVKRDSRTPE